uniref:Reverse transcriptase Ty1/copia-type domain-containing protein n=1 Tax=Fagus sylvatica TaxID=28930 RepID=A0A2N9ELZ6_FAGSY
MRSMMVYADLQIVFWGEALSTAAYILNTVKTKSKLLTPFEIYTRHQPDMTNLKVWDFLDKDLENSGRKRTSPEPTMPSIDADDSGRKRQRRPSSVFKDYYLTESKVVAIEDDPANFTKAMESHDAKQWLKAMHEELDSISKNEVWDLTELPTGRKPVGCKCVLRKKYKADGSLDKYKARLVAKGFTQQPGVDFVDTYLSMAKFASVRIIMAILDIGYEMSPLDHCVDVWRDKEKLALLSLYVDDILLASNSPDMMKETKLCLVSKFEMKDMGLGNYVLGIRISRDRDSKLIYLDHKNYLEKVLKRFKMEDCRPVSTPVSKGTIPNKSMCLTNKTGLINDNCSLCPSYGQSNVHNDEHKTRYMLCGRIDELEIKGFTNADFAGDTDDRKSTSEYVFLFGGTAVSWLSKKQGCVAKYTMEAEYIACSTAVSNAVWIKRFMDSLKLDMQDRPVNVFCDNKSTISLIKSRANSSKGKHIDVNYHYIQDIVEMGEIKVHFVPSTDMMANPMTKGLTLNQFRVHVTGMGLRGNSVELHGSARSDGSRDA